MYIKLSLKVFIFALFFCLTNQFEIYLLLMLFAIIHEMGHIISGILVGFKIQKLEILPIGFAVSFKLNTVDFNKKIFKANLLTIKKIIIAFSGPLVNLIFIILFIILGKETIFNIKTELLIYVNMLIFLFNMIIIYPLDGRKNFEKCFIYILWERKSTENYKYNIKFKCYFFKYIGYIHKYIFSKL